MANIVRTATRATGGITEDEKLRLAEHKAKWIARAMRTEAIEPDKIVPAIKSLYAVAGLKEPRVVIVPSPLVMAFAYGAAAAIWHGRKNPGKALVMSTLSATRAATLDATEAATRAATDAATLDATYDATYDATRVATEAATRVATRAATDAATYDATDAATFDAAYAPFDLEQQAALACHTLAGRFGLECAKKWSIAYQGGNMWASSVCYLTALRDVIGLRLDAYEKYATWEQAAIHGGFRVMHEGFCLVVDFPEVLKVDQQHRPHCEDGPSHRWRDGWSKYHWHGVRVPAHWIENRDDLRPEEVLNVENVEQRAAGAAIIGWPKMARLLGRKIIDGNPNSDLGALIELTIPGIDEPGRFLQAICPRNGTIVEGVPRISDIDGLPIETAVAAQAWRDGLPVAEYQHPPYRT